MVRFLRREAEEERERDKRERGKDGSNSVMDDYFKILHEEITLDILTRLPTESALDSKLVCTNWRKIISNHPSFSRMHFHHHLNHPSGKLGFLVSTHSKIYGAGLYYFDYNENQLTTPIQRINLTSPFESFRFVGSINGLICLINKSQRHPSVFICNPITRECVMLPDIKIDSDIHEYVYADTCFGYVSSTNEYKIVKLYDLEADFQVHIYTLGSGNGWRNLGKVHYGSSVYLKYSVYFANGTLYWLDHDFKKIVVFNLAEENFGEHLSPPHLPPDTNWNYCHIGVLNGYLFFASWYRRDGFSDVWLWEKKNHNNNKEEREVHQSLGWRKVFRINNMGFLAVTKSGGVLTNRYDQIINIYDTKTLTWKSLVEFNSYIAQIHPHMNTLVSLKELGEEDTKVMAAAETKICEQQQEDVDPEYIFL